MFNEHLKPFVSVHDLFQINDCLSRSLWIRCLESVKRSFASKSDAVLQLQGFQRANNNLSTFLPERLQKKVALSPASSDFPDIYYSLALTNGAVRCSGFLLFQ